MNRDAVTKAWTALNATIVGRHDTASLASAKLGYGKALGSWLPQDPNQDPTLLDAQHPIVLFPVRLETRFDKTTPELRIRVYPDEVLANAHEPGLTAEESADAAAYWADANGAVGEPEAWRVLVAKYRAPRAAWLAQAGRPGAPPPAQRAASWSTAVHADLLPDRWCAVAYRGTAEVGRAFSNPIIQPLALTVGPDTDPIATTDVSGDGLTLDDGVVWTVNFDRAVAAGMAIRLPLTAADLVSGFDRLIVVGVRASLDPTSAAQAIGDLFNAHHYGQGWAFVPQGTPTRNVAGQPSGYPPADDNGRESFRVERGAALTANAVCDGVAWARAMGIDSTVVAHVDGADGMEQAGARAMNRALFSGTLGYYLSYFMNPVIPDQATANMVGVHFVDWVRGRGPLPAWRVGDVPYGIVPITSLDRWQADTKATGVDRQLPPLLQKLRPIWAKPVPHTPHMGSSAEADWDLIEIFCMEASAREIRVRPYLGPVLQWGLTQLLGANWQSWQLAQQSDAGASLTAIGHADWNPFIRSGVFTEDTAVFGGPLVADSTSETDSLTSNYINWILTASVDDLDKNAVPYKALLYLLLRYSALIEYSNAAMDLLISANMAASGDRFDHDVIQIVPDTEKRLTMRQQMLRSITGVTQGKTIGEYLSPGGASTISVPPVLISSFRDALRTLGSVPTAELERLFTETLDLSTDRLDAWITSLASKRLDAMRTSAPTGTHIGAVAWVENLRPANPAAPAYGHVHAPSAAHAATAAVLRNAYLTYAGTPNAAPYAIDLSSARVRAGKFVLDGVREGQQVGAIFGYQLERGLHDRQADVLIDSLRGMFPLVGNKTEDSGQSAESIAARNVVDGLALRTAVQANGFPYDTLATALGSPLTQDLRTALDAELAALEDTVDSVADLLLAESVHQVVRGNLSAASASLDNLAIGARPPDPDVAAMPRGGTPLIHRVGVVVGGAPLATTAGWPATATPRAKAEPRLDAWVGALLGDPTTVRCRVVYFDAHGQATETDVTLDALQLRPLDVVALATTVLTTPMASELDRRVVAAALTGVASATEIRVIYDAASSWDRTVVRSFPEVLTLAQAIQNVLGAARGLEPTDLVPPYQAGAATAAGGWLDNEVVNRATAAESALTTVGTSVHTAVLAVQNAGATPTAAQLQALHDALVSASQYGLPAAFPATVGVDEGSLAPSFLAQGQAVDAEIARRLALSASHHPAGGASATDRVAAAQTMARDLFGGGFVLLPGFAPTSQQELGNALTYAGTLVPDPQEASRWVQRVARVRAPIARWRSMWLLAEASRPLSATQPGPTWAKVDIVQLPYTQGALWMALPLRTEADRVAGRVSVVLHRAVAAAATDPWYGLMLDEWTEVIPNPIEQTALAFGYDDPGGEAPQAVFLAVPPTDAKQWDMDTLLAIVNETIDLAKIRGVGLSQLTEIAQLIPGVFLFADPANESYSTTLLDQLYNPPMLV